VTGGQTSTSIPPGSYRLVVDGAGLASVFYPFEIERGQRLELDVAVPRASSVPDGFAFIPAGEFWFGDGDEQLRTQFLGTVPIHKRRTEAYLIAVHETTYEEWIRFLNVLPAAERPKRLPDVSTAARGSLQLREKDDSWQLTFQPTTRRYTALAGEPVVYEGRSQHVRQDWLRFPVTGIAVADIERYLAWLRTSGRIPTARLCTEIEWERAARGADDRLFSHGDDLLPEDADFDLTYGRVATAYGPDMVSSHPSSRSPFGIDDLVGNALEFAVSSQKRDEYVIRGGGYFFGAASCRATNRESVPPGFRDVGTGIRVCASPQKDM
jgi:formylglycine-generating enzyme required for sulfatase activity